MAAEVDAELDLKPALERHYAQLERFERLVECAMERQDERQNALEKLIRSLAAQNGQNGQGSAVSAPDHACLQGLAIPMTQYGVSPRGDADVASREHKAEHDAPARFTRSNADTGMKKTLREAAHVTPVTAQASYASADARDSTRDSTSTPAVQRSSDAGEKSPRETRRMFNSQNSDESSESSGDDNFLTYADRIKERERELRYRKARSGTVRAVRTSYSCQAEVQEHVDSQGAVVRTIAQVVFNRHFDDAVVVLIFVYCLFVGWQVECSSIWTDCGALEHVLDGIDIAFWFLFALELVLRYAVSGATIFFFGELRYWNMLDSLLVIVSTIDLVMGIMLRIGSDQQLSIVRLTRAMRSARIIKVVRVLRFFADLRILLNGIMGCLRPLLWAMFLLFMIIYIFGVVFASGSIEYLRRTLLYTPEFGETSPNLQIYFGSVPRAMFSLLKAISGGIDWGILTTSLSDLSGAYIVLFVWYIMFIIFAVSNVMTGVFCQNALETAQRDNYEVVQELLSEKEKLIAKLKAVTADTFRDAESGVLQLNDFEEKMQSAALKAWFESIGIDVEDGWTLFKLIDTEATGIVSLENFVDGCVRLRGQAKKIDIEQIMYEEKRILKEIAMLQDKTTQLAKSTAKVTKRERRSRIAFANFKRETIMEAKEQQGQVTLPSPPTPQVTIATPGVPHAVDANGGYHLTPSSYDPAQGPIFLA